MYYRRSPRRSLKRTADHLIIWTLLLVSLLFSTLIPVYFANAALVGH